MKANAHKIGAVFYVLWGVLHVFWGASMLYTLSSEGGAGVLAAVGTAVPQSELPKEVSGVGSGLLGQHNWNLLWFGLFAIVVGAFFNWKNSRPGYWVNLAVVSAADLGFIFAIMVPGYIKFADGFMGPLLWILAVIFSTIGIRGGKPQAA